MDSQHLDLRGSSQLPKPSRLWYVCLTAICSPGRARHTDRCWKNRRLISYGGGDNIATSRPLANNRGGVSKMGARRGAAVGQQECSRHSTLTELPGQARPANFRMFSRKARHRNKRLHEYWYRHRSCRRPSRLFEWQSGAFNPSPFSHRAGPTVQPPLASTHGPNTKSRRPEDFEVKWGQSRRQPDTPRNRRSTTDWARLK